MTAPRDDRDAIARIRDLFRARGVDLASLTDAELVDLSVGFLGFPALCRSLRVPELRLYRLALVSDAARWAHDDARRRAFTGARIFAIDAELCARGEPVDPAAPEGSR